MLAYQQGMVFQKFKKNIKLVNAVTEFEISKNNLNFKLDIVNFIDKYPKNAKILPFSFLFKKQFSNDKKCLPRT